MRDNGRASKFNIYNRNGTLKKRFQILEWCCDYADEHNGNSPSTREIAAEFDCSQSAVQHHLSDLENFGGYVLRKNGKLVIYRAKWIRPPQFID